MFRLHTRKYSIYCKKQITSKFDIFRLFKICFPQTVFQNHFVFSLSTILLWDQHYVHDLSLSSKPKNMLMHKWQCTSSSIGLWFEWANGLRMCVYDMTITQCETGLAQAQHDCALASAWSKYVNLLPKFIVYSKAHNYHYKSKNYMTFICWCILMILIFWFFMPFIVCFKYSICSADILSIVIVH